MIDAHGENWARVLTGGCWGWGAATETRESPLEVCEIKYQIIVSEEMGGGSLYSRRRIRRDRKLANLSALSGRSTHHPPA